MNTNQMDREQLRQALRRSLGLPALGGPLAAEARGTLERPGLVVEKWVWTAEPGSRVPAVLYRPAAPEGPLPGVVLTCGHGDSKSQWYMNYIGQLYATLGLACLALDPIGEEERHSEARMGTRAHDPAPVIERAAAAGRPIMGKLVFDTMRGVDFLAARDDIDAGRLAVAGNSLGGAKAGWMLALDQRLVATLVSGWAFGDHMLVSGKRCTTQPNALLRRLCGWGEFLALAAPHNAVLLLNGDRDQIIDRADDGTAWRQTEAAVTEANAAYAGADRRIELFYEGGGGHRPYHGYRAALLWLQRYIGTPGWDRGRIEALPSVNAGDWCRRHGVEIEPLYATRLNCGGATLPDVGLAPIGRQQLACLQPDEVGAPEYTLEGWLAAVA